MTRKKRRLILITVCGSVLALAVGLILFAMSGSIVFFRSPSEIEAQAIPAGTRLRLGGLVQDGSLKRGPGQTIDFAVTDHGATIAVQYTGLLPDLFREGQGVVAEGVLERATGSRPIRFWPSTTNPTCPARSPTPSRSRAAGRRAGRRRRGSSASAGGTLGPRSER